MEIVIATYSGFCEGVASAYKIAKNISSDGPVFMLGDLVHNAEVVHRIKEHGIKTVSALTEVPRSASGTPPTIIISAHGVGPEIYTEAHERGLKIIDTTCPWVKKAQQLAKQLSTDGRTVIIIGDRNHPEVKGLRDWCGPNAMVIENEEDALMLSLSGPAGVISQTTQSQSKFDAIVKILQAKIKDLAVRNSICGATSKRQQSALEISAEVDCMLVIGDKKSANTKRLYELSLENQPKTHWIQTAEELDLAWLNKSDKIGITAGASTPEWVVDAVVKRINANKN